MYKEKIFLPSVIIVTIFHIVAIAGLDQVTLKSFFYFIITYFYFAIFGITLGYHRYFSHKSFRCANWLHYLLAISSTLTWQGSPLFWAAIHRMHHIKTDQKGDAHSSKKGFLWSHISWVFYKNPNGFTYAQAAKTIREWKDDPFVLFLDKNVILVNVIVLVFFAYVIGIYYSQWDIFLAVFPLRVVANWHSTWLLNSFAHSAKLINEEISDTTISAIKNSYLLQFLQAGDGFHLNHHLNPNAPYTSIKISEFDLSYWILKALSYFGAVTLK